MAHLDVGNLEAVNVQSLHVCVGLSILEEIKKEAAGLFWESALQAQMLTCYAASTTHSSPSTLESASGHMARNKPVRW